MGFKKFLSDIKESREGRKEARRRAGEEREAFENGVNGLLDKFEIPTWTSS